MMSRPTIVLDVNVLVSGFLIGGGPPAEVVQLWEHGSVEVVLSEHVISTVQNVWSRPFFVSRSDRIDRSLAMELMHEQARLVEPDLSVAGVADDTEDDLVLGTAVAANADFLVTGDRGLLAIREFENVRIVTARELLSLLNDVP